MESVSEGGEGREGSEVKRGGEGRAKSSSFIISTMKDFRYSPFSLSVI